MTMSQRYAIQSPRPKRKFSSNSDCPISPRSPMPRVGQTMSIPAVNYSHSHTQRVSMSSVGTAALRPYLRNFLFLFLEERNERVLPRRILNTSILFRNLLRQNDFCVDVFKDTLEVLASLALYKAEYRTSDAYIKVLNLVNEEFKIPLDKMVPLVLQEPRPTDSRLAAQYYCSKLHFAKNICRLLKYYSFTDEVKFRILSMFEKNFSKESSDYELEENYSTKIKEVHLGITNSINNSVSEHELINPINTLSQFITHVLPSPQELIANNPPKPKPLIIDGKYEDTESFLKTHYELLREDMIQPLRSAIKDYIKGDDKARRALFIYDEVTFLYPECDANQGLMYRLKFNVCGVKDVSRMKWDRSERLKFGTLLCIAEQINGRAIFRNIMWAIVSDRNARSLQNSLTIAVKFPSGFESRVDFSRTYIMLESRQVYFESYCHTLSGLHSMREIPFSELLLVQTLEVKHPEYIRENTRFNLSPIFPDLSDPVFLSLGQWPDTSPKLDSSQYKALRLALTKEVSLIQGPPGTGKTYVGAIALEIILETKRAYYLHLDAGLFSETETDTDTDTEEITDETDTEQRVAIPLTQDQEAYMEALESPILILTYTNHALDQFLMLLLRFESRIVRIGSKVEQEELLPHCLPEIRRRLMPPRDKRLREETPFLPEHVFKLKKERGQLMSKAWAIKEEIAGIAAKLQQPYVTFLDITNLCSETQINSIYKVSKDFKEKEDEVLYQWVKGVRGYTNVSGHRKQTPRQENRERAPSQSEEIHFASDDEDTVDDRDRYREDLNEYSGGRQNIAVWDSLHQVLTDYEFDQIKSGLPDVPVHLKDVGDLWSLSTEDRVKLYDYWLCFKRRLLLLMVEERSEWFSILCVDIERVNREIDLCILKEAAVIGMTTTGAARNSELIRQLNPRIIVVEEAAEVLEAHIIAALTPQVQQLILIGDHQQLRPSCAEYKLAQEANLEVSLFERLVKNNIEHVTLQQQHRMRPEISELISPIYPQLIDHEVVRNYEVLYGVRENIFFIDHNIPEDNCESDNTTKTHKYEARYLAHLANYLVNRGYSTSEITILTFYQGQKFCILDQLRQLGIRLRVSTVDKYQGEENRVVLFSVVRSNKQNNIGHCSIDNRVCVALSRAKEGLVMIGNTASLRKASKGTHSKLWNKVLDFFGDKRINKTFPLYCHKHPQYYQDIHSPEELAKFKDGVCKELCEEKMDCGHKCKLLCHYINHRKVKCQEYCERINPQCGHPCLKEDGSERKLCYERCDLCNYRVTKTLQECFHKKQLPCHTIPTHSLCVENCEETRLCGHPCVKENGITPKLCVDPCGQCNYRVRRVLPCGHDKMLPCHLDPLSAQCDEPCTKTKNCGHPCTGRCNENCDSVECKEKVIRNLTCTHDIEVACSVDINRIYCHKPCLNRLSCDHPCPLKCYEKCRDTSCRAYCNLERACGHPCVRPDQSRKFCAEDCQLCAFLVTKTIEVCKHRVGLMCSVEPTHSACTEICNRILSCGHACELFCKQECNEKLCARIIPKYCPCGHVNEMECSADSAKFMCKQTCLLLLPCGHKCPLPCEESCEDATCEQPCEFKFPCGHPCLGKTGEPKACYEDCGKCNKRVTKKLDVCGHELELACSQKPLHSLCKKACNRKKECNHQCTGLCGEKCSAVECRKEVKRELKCKHVKKAICSFPLDQIKCEEKCRENLPCGHPCNKKCYEDCTSTECQISVTTELPCGHSVEISCHEKQNKLIPVCTEPCKKLLPCGHECTGDCGDDCLDFVCQVKILIKLNCKHLIKFPCSNRLKSFPNNSPSDVYHIINCKLQDCGLCYSIRNNYECNRPCSKELSCGHKCVEVCHHPVVCHPCKDFCISKCVHARCPLPCGDICRRCEVKCEWECEHHKCTKQCWEVCNRPVCNKFCPLRLKCGHPCVGLCGEICPDICFVCDPKHKAIQECNGEPLISLFCGHYFSRSKLDSYFNKIKDGTVTPCCPECNAPIYTTYRYGAIVKRIQSKIDEKKYIKLETTLSHINLQFSSLFVSPHLVKPFPKHLLSLFDRILHELPEYQLTKLYTIIDLLGILAGLVNHTREARNSYFQKKLLESKTLELLIKNPTTPDDGKDISYINNLALMCEIVSVFSVVNSHPLPGQDLLLLKMNYKSIFSQKPEQCEGYLTQLHKFVSKNSIQSEYLFKFTITRPKVIAELEVTPISEHRNSESVLAATSPSAKKLKISNSTAPSQNREYSHKSPKTIKPQLITFEKTKRSAPSQPTNQPKAKITKIEFETKPETDQRKVTIRNERKQNRPSRWDNKHK